MNDRDKGRTNPQAADKSFMTLHIALPTAGIERTVTVAEWMNLQSLHDAIQVVMGWEDMHAWRFENEKSGRAWAVPEKYPAERFDGKKTLDAGEVALSEAFPQPGCELTYRYSPIDDWRLKVKRVPDSVVQAFACIQAKGPDAIEDIGGETELARFLDAMREDPDDDCWADVREFNSMEDPEDLAAYLKGADILEKTRLLRKKIRDVIIRQQILDFHKTTHLTDDDKARFLGWKLATVVNAYIWDSLQEALENGGTCQYEDLDLSISDFLRNVFPEVEVDDTETLVSEDALSTLTVPREWIGWYAKKKFVWLAMREQFDIMENYACAAANLYGILTIADLRDLMLRYDPGYGLSIHETTLYLSLRSVWEGGNYRIEDGLVVFSNGFRNNPWDDGELDSKKRAEKILKAQKEIPRWYPKDREAFFEWACIPDYKDLQETLCVRMILGAQTKLGKDELDDLMDAICAFLGQGLSPANICQRLVKSKLIGRLNGRPLQNLTTALEAWRMKVRSQLLNGHTLEEMNRIQKKVAPQTTAD